MIATRLLVAACLLPMVIAASADEKFDTRTASFAVTFHDETSAYRDAAVIVLPGASVVFQTVGGPPGDYAAVTTDGTLVQQGLHQWKWTAPDRPGTYLITFEGPGKKDAIAMHGFVMVPADRRSRTVCSTAIASASTPRRRSKAIRCTCRRRVSSK